MNLNFIGVRGAGKSNVSRRVAVAIKRPVLSSDVLIAYDNDGLTIAQIVENNGGDWRVFRDLEYAVVRQLTRLDEIIVDWGGGVVVDLDARGYEIYSARKVDLIRSSGPVIWLNGDIDRLVAQTRNSHARPALDELIPAAEIMRRRLPFYQRAADITINIDGKRRKEIADEVISLFGHRG